MISAQRDLSHLRRLGRALSMIVLSACGFASASAVARSQEAAATRQYAAAAALQNREQFELAADEWSALLKKFPGDPRAPRARHYLGLCQLKTGQYGAAAQTFATLVADLPRLPVAALRVESEGGQATDLIEPTYLYWGVAEYDAARSAQQPAAATEYYARAAGAFQALLQKYPQGPYASQALFYSAEVAYARGEKQQAVGLYQTLIRRFPRDRLLGEALYGLGTAQEALGESAAAGATYATFLRDFHSSPLAGEVSLRYGETLLAGGKPAEAQRQFAAAAATAHFKLADLAMLREATCQYDQKQYAQAAETYAGLARRFPDSKHRGEAQLAAGKCQYLAGQYDAALALLEPLAGAPGDAGAEATHWQARALLKQKQPAEALRVVERATKTAGGTWAAELALDRADSLYESPTTRAQATDAYRTLADDFPKSDVAPQARYLAAFGALELRRYAQAGEQARTFLKHYAGHALTADVLYVEAEAHLLEGNAAAADREYGELLAKFSSRPEVPLWTLRRGLALFLTRQYEAAIRTLEPVATSRAANGNVAEARYLTGSAYDELKQDGRAVEWLESSLAADAHWHQADEARLALAQAYWHQHKAKDALAQLERLVKEHPTSSIIDRAHFRRGEYAFAEGDYAQATAAYRRVLEDTPNSSLAGNALYGMAWAELKQNNPAAAEETLDRFLRNDPRHELAPRARYARALARQQLKQYQPAIDDLEAYLKTKPSGSDRSDARYLLGVCQAGAGKASEAAKTLGELAHDDPRYSAADKVLYELAWALKAQGDGAKAADAFERLASTQPKSPLAAESQYHVGEFYYDAHKYARAASAFYEAMQKAGKSDLGQTAAYKLGWAYFHDGRFDQARQTFAYLRGTFPTGELASDAAFMEGESLLKAKKYKEAVAAYSAVKKPKQADLLLLAEFHAGQALAQLGDWKASLTELQKAEQADPKSAYLSDILYEEAWALQNLDRLDDALKLYEQVTERSDAEVAARARFMIGEIYFQKKDHAQAVKNFFKVSYGYAYPEWQAAAQYEAGRCFEVLGKQPQAIESYREVVDKYPQTSKAGLAKERLAALGKGAAP